MFHLLSSFVLTLIVILHASASDSIWPGPYQKLPKGRNLRVVSVWGEPLQSSASAMTPNGKLGVYVCPGGVDSDGNSRDSFLFVYDVGSGRLVRQVLLPKMGIHALYGLAITPDGGLALTGLVRIVKKKMTYHLHLWDLRKGTEAKNLGEQKSSVAAVALSADGKRALVSTADDGLHLWDVQEPKPLAHFRTLGGFALAFHPDPTRVISSDVSDLVVWDIATKKPIRTMEGERPPGNEVFTVALSKNGNRAVSCAAGSTMNSPFAYGTIQLWDLEKGSEIGSLKMKAADFVYSSVAFAGNDRKAIAVWSRYFLPSKALLPPHRQADHEIIHWDGSTGKTLWSRKLHLHEPMPPIAVNAAGSQAVLGGGANFFSRWNLTEGKEESVWGAHKGAINALVADREGTVFSASEDGSIKVWVNGKPIKTFTGHSAAINALALSKDGKFLVSGSADKTVKLWEVATGRVRKTFVGHTGSVSGVAIAPDTRWIVSGSEDRTIRFWDVAAGKERQNLGHGDRVKRIALAPDGSWISSTCYDHTVRLWPIEDGKAGTLQILEQNSSIACIAFSPNGKRLLTGGSADSLLKLWDVGKGKCLTTLKGHENWLTAVLFLDERQAISASDDGTVRVWNIDAGKQIGHIDLGAANDSPRSLAVVNNRNDVLVGTRGWVILNCRRDEK